MREFLDARLEERKAHAQFTGAPKRVGVVGLHDLGAMDGVGSVDRDNVHIRPGQQLRVLSRVEDPRNV
ncbi:MAG: hypothetical protein H6Q29_1422, partial [Bacteroidetes bacterium]|nr:hypothetical protein [Bacteroidota bacterium]